MLIWLHAASGLEVHTVTSMTAQKKIETFVQLEISFRKKGVIKTAKTFNLVCLLHQQCVIQQISYTQNNIVILSPNKDAFLVEQGPCRTATLQKRCQKGVSDKKKAQITFFTIPLLLVIRRQYALFHSLNVLTATFTRCLAYEAY